MSVAEIPNLTPFSLQDFPGFVSCIVWFSGCNFRCSYCHNPELVKAKVGSMDPETLDAFLAQRVGKLDGVVFSGGECTLCEGIFELAEIVKKHGLLLKLDTNGSRPDVLRRMFDRGLIDAVAMDFKAPFSAYGRLTSWSNVARWKESFSLVNDRLVSFEIRTTVHADLLSEEDVSEMMGELDSLGYEGDYFVQNFREGDTLGYLGKPSCRFDTSKLPSYRGINLQLRNFN